MSFRRAVASVASICSGLSASGAPVLVSFALLLSPQLALAQFTQQGQKLVGTGAVGGAYQGISVALSADGNTAIVGGIGDNSNAGAAWVYTRSGGVWSQQGSKLVGADFVGDAYQGSSVALSADGNIAIVGGPHDAIVGGPYDNDFSRFERLTGAAWVFTRSKGVWSQQGSKLVGSGAVGNARQSQSVALSADGKTAIVGGPDDNSYTSAAWVYTRNFTGQQQVDQPGAGKAQGAQDRGLVLTVGRLSTNPVGAFQVLAVENKTTKGFSLTVECGFYAGGKLVGSGEAFFDHVQPRSIAHRNAVALNASDADNVKCRIADAH